MPSAPDRPIVCLVSDGRDLPAADRDRWLLERIQPALQAGVDWVQIREKDLSAKRLVALTRDLVRLASGMALATKIFVNDRLDVAIAAAAAGVHLGGESLSPQDVVRWCQAGHAPPDFRIGVSCHSLGEAQQAASAGAHYLFFGPVFDTPSKRRFGAPQGLARLGEVCAAVNIPVIAIGGITATNAPDCVRAGAQGIAAIRLFQGARVHAVSDLVSKLDSLRG